jgi:GDP-4-dehydro-6-deoxy-D-mannose reductase
MNIVITGVGGFVGRYLVQELRNALGSRVHINGITDIPVSPDIAEHLDNSTVIDITNKTALRDFLLPMQPDAIYHLAAQSSAALSLKKPVETIQNNITGTLNVLDVVREDLHNHPRILNVGSAEVYGAPADGSSIDENVPLCPLNPYAASKAAADYISFVYYKSFGVKAIRTRSFNHIGPGQSDMFVMSNFAKQIALIENGLQEAVLHTGNLQARRDFTDVRDVVRAYRMLMESGDVGEAYNVCSGIGYPIGELLEILLHIDPKHSKNRITIEQDIDRMRPAENPVLIGSNQKLKAKTGWEPKIPIETMLYELLHYWREKVKREYSKCE